MTRVAVIGAGVMGLAAAYHLAKRGHAVEVFEADAVPGGMAAHFDLDGLSIERFYHFICKSDQPTFDLLAELGIADRLRWRETRMGYFYRGKVHPWGNPFALLRFPHLSLVAKFRYGLHVFLSTRRKDWRTLDRLHADDWIKAWVGNEAWQVLWEKLFTLKFYEYAHDISAAWIWSRIKRIGTSRKNIFTEELGYLAGGSETLIHALVARIEALGGHIHLSAPTTAVHVEQGAVTAITTNRGREPFEAVISTIPLPLVPRLIPALSAEAKTAYARVVNIGVVCVVHKLRKSLTKNFWLNVNDPAMGIPGLVEFSNLRDLADDTVVYVPYYMPVTNPDFTKPDAAFIEQSFGYMKRINPEIDDDDRLASNVGRLRLAQPVCPPGFLDDLPPVVSAVTGLQIADTSVYYPEDRGIAESVRLGREMAERIH